MKNDRSQKKSDGNNRNHGHLLHQQNALRYALENNIVVFTEAIRICFEAVGKEELIAELIWLHVFVDKVSFVCGV